VAILGALAIYLFSEEGGLLLKTILLLPMQLWVVIILVLAVVVGMYLIIHSLSKELKEEKERLRKKFNDCEKDLDRWRTECKEIKKNSNHS